MGGTVASDDTDGSSDDDHSAAVAAAAAPRRKKPRHGATRGHPQTTTGAPDAREEVGAQILNSNGLLGICSE